MSLLSAQDRISFGYNFCLFLDRNCIHRKKMNDMMNFKRKSLTKMTEQKKKRNKEKKK